MFYIMLTAPRIWSNALTLSISPRISLIMFVVELLIMLYESHRLATPLHQNDSFPSELVTGVINFLCPCTPVSNLGFVNLFSTLLIIFKVILLYPIAILNLLPVQDNFDRFRCDNNARNASNSTDFNNTNSKMINLDNNTIAKNLTDFPRPCNLSLIHI